MTVTPTPTIEVSTTGRVAGSRGPEVHVAGLAQQLVEAGAAKDQGGVLTQHRIHTGSPGRAGQRGDQGVRAFDQELGETEPGDQPAAIQRQPAVGLGRHRQAEAFQPGDSAGALAAVTGGGGHIGDAEAGHGGGLGGGSEQGGDLGHRAHGESGNHAASFCLRLSGS